MTMKKREFFTIKKIKLAKKVTPNRNTTKLITYCESHSTKSSTKIKKKIKIKQVHNVNGFQKLYLLTNGIPKLMGSVMEKEKETTNMNE